MLLVTAHGGRTRGLLRVGVHARHRFDRVLPGDRAIEHARHGIDIGPGTLIAAAVILLDRAIARREHSGECLRARRQRLAGSAEVDQHRRAILADIDVLGLDIAMQDASLVTLGQAVQQRMPEFEQLLI